MHRIVDSIGRTASGHGRCRLVCSLAKPRHLLRKLVSTPPRTLRLSSHTMCINPALRVRKHLSAHGSRVITRSDGRGWRGPMACLVDRRALPLDVLLRGRQRGVRDLLLALQRGEHQPRRRARRGHRRTDPSNLRPDPRRRGGLLWSQRCVVGRFRTSCSQPKPKLGLTSVR